MVGDAGNIALPPIPSADCQNLLEGYLFFRRDAMTVTDLSAKG